MKKMIICDACKGQFEVDDRRIRNRQAADGVLFTFFQCPHCEAAFLISASDARFRKLLAQRAKGMKRNRNTAFMSPEEVRRLSDEQKRMYAPRFRELVPTAYTEEVAE